MSRIFQRFSRTSTSSIPVTSKVEPKSHEQFDTDHGFQLHKQPSVRERIKQFRRNHRCSLPCFTKFLLSVFPFVKILRDYNPRTDLLSDVIAGLTVCVMHIPQGMAYGLLAGLPPVYGLYSSLFPVTLYCIFGTSRHLSFGAMAISSLMVSNSLTRLLMPDAIPNFVTMLGASNPNFLDSNSNSTNTSTSFSVTAAAVTVTSSASSSVLSVSTAPNSPCSSSSNAPLSDADLVQIGDRIMSVTELRVEIAIAMTLLTGLIQVVLSLLRLGFLTIYLSEPLVSGFTTASAVYVATSQLSPILGYSVPNYSGPLNLVYTYIALFGKIQKFNVISFGIAAVTAVIIGLFKEKVQPLINKRVKFPVPIDLVMIAISTVISYFVQLNNHGVMIIGKIPAGIPPPRVPDVRFFPSMIRDCSLMAIIGYATTYSMASILARKHGYEVSGNQEMLANGLANAISAFFNCHVTSTSLSRSVVQVNAGAKSQITALISCVGILLVLLFLAPLFQFVPRCVLSAIIIVALKNFFLQFGELRKLWRTSKYDFAIWIASFVATVLMDVDYGLVCGFVFSVFTIMLRTQAPHTCELGRMRHTSLYKNVHMYSDIVTYPGIKVIRFDGGLYFASKDYLRTMLAHRTGLNAAKELRRRKRHHHSSPSPSHEHESRQIVEQNDRDAVELVVRSEENAAESLQRQPDSKETRLTHIVLDCSSITFIDTAGVRILSQIIEEYAAVDVRVFLAGPHANVREILEKMDFYEKHARDLVLVTTHDAVLAALKEQQKVLEEATGLPKDLQPNAAASQAEGEVGNAAQDNQVPIPEEVQEADRLALANQTAFRSNMSLHGEQPIASD